VIDLRFAPFGVDMVPFSATPQLALKLEISCAARRRIHSILLESQIRIQPTERVYSELEASKLQELFGERQRWDSTLRSMLWTRANVMVPAFEERVVVQVPLPCSYDFTLAATRYFEGIEQGHVPLLVLHSGSVFVEDEDGALQVERIPWSRETSFLLPIAIYREAVNHYFPNQVPLTIHRDVFERLARYKSRAGCASLEAALEGLLRGQERAP
jgi:hypothetical protein